MKQTTKIQLGTETIMNLPLQNYKEEFTFVVNGKYFKTNRLIADLLSPNICKFHSTDAANDTFTIKTKAKGNFSHVIDLIKFEQIDIPMDEIPFICEVIANLGNTSIRFLDKIQKTIITTDNVFELIQKHQRFENFYSKELVDDIDFISTHFYELCITRKDDLVKLPFDVLLNIVNNNSLQLTDEDQLLHFINELYSKNTDCSIMYETVFFSNISSKMMKEFIKVFKFKDVSKNIWTALLSRLENEEENESVKFNNKSKVNDEISRYESVKKQGIMFPLLSNKNFSGIFNYLYNKTNGNIEDEIILTTTSEISNTSGNSISNAFLFNDILRDFVTDDNPNSWMCFDFKNSRVAPTFYTIKSTYLEQYHIHPKSWVIEGSIDNTSWEILDEQKNCSFLNGPFLVHTFKIQNLSLKEFKFIRMRITGPNWYNDHRLSIKSFELYGRLI